VLSLLPGFKHGINAACISNVFVQRKMAVDVDFSTTWTSNRVLNISVNEALCSVLEILDGLLIPLV